MSALTTNSSTYLPIQVTQLCHPERSGGRYTSIYDESNMPNEVRDLKDIIIKEFFFTTILNLSIKTLLTSLLQGLMSKETQVSQEDWKATL